MAGIHFQPPEKFDFKQPDEWPRWLKRFEQFRIASGLSEESDKRQVNTLLYCLGEEGEDLLRSTNITEDERKSYSSVRQKLNGFFQMRKNIIFERAKFNRRSQLAGETADQFIVSLYSLVENCNYAGLKEEMIRDRLVVGIRDIALAEKLQLDAELTLEKAKKAIRQRKAINEHQDVLIGDRKASTQITVDAIQQAKKSRKPVRAKKPERGSSTSAPAPKQCTHCGKEYHKRDKWPARDATCHKCQHKGHYSSQCFTKSVVATVTSQERDSNNFLFLDTIGTDTPSTWMVSLKIRGKEIAFKVDTGAAVTATSKECHELLEKPELHKPTKCLQGPDNQSLNVVGQSEENISHNCKSSKQHIFVIDNLRVNLLGLPCIIALNLVSRVDSTTDYTAMIEEKFPSLFRGLGTLGDPYTIQLKPDAKPRAFIIHC